MRTIYILASVPCAIAGCVLSVTGEVVTFAGDAVYTLGWALLERGRL